MSQAGTNGLAIGVDLIEIEQVARLVGCYGQRFLERIYTPAEQLYCRNQVTKLAKIFAAKEAVSKALGVGLAYMAPPGVEPLDMEIISNEPDQPSLCLHGSARSRAEALGLSTWCLSLSHSRKYAVAFVIAASVVPGPVPNFRKPLGGDLPIPDGSEQHGKIR